MCARACPGEAGRASDAEEKVSQRYPGMYKIEGKLIDLRTRSRAITNATRRTAEKEGNPQNWEGP